jgi:hypothetical protein
MKCEFSVFTPCTAVYVRRPLNWLREKTLLKNALQYSYRMCKLYSSVPDP